MTDSLDPVDTSHIVSDTYRRYLRSLLPVQDEPMADALNSQIANSRMLTKGPLLEATPPYATGASLRELIEEHVLEPGLLNLASDGLPLDRPLYQHQESALRRAARGRNLVVATGTGSGKTESFLLPILSSLTAEHTQGTLGPGVRGMLLYPMNALANDQLKRLRQLLANAPHITFGRYTGDTPERTKEAQERFEELNPGEPLLPNELISREQMRAEPPHLLLTNYAMLEYLLLRPADMELFEGNYGGKWNWLVLDEAHVYDGAKAEELAMLLRRLRDRVAPDESLQCIATSATVGDEPTAVVDFASKLFHAPFIWEEDGEQDLVTASQVATPDDADWGPLSGDTYRQLAGLEKLAEQVVDFATNSGFTTGDPAHALAYEQTMTRLRNSLATEPGMFDELATRLFPDDAQPEEALEAMVAVGNKVTDSTGSPLLSARYHLFARATEGAFSCLTDAGPHVSLARHEQCEECAATMFEIGACKRCGAIHLIGAVHNDSDGLRFATRVRNQDRRVWLLLGESLGQADEDDETLESSAELNADEAYLCATCGTLHKTGNGPCGRDGCNGTVRHVRQLDTKQDSPSGCLACGSRGTAMVRQFESGNDAAVAVLSTALYQALPAANDDEIADQPGEGRKLLMFSDSRQSAAFFAPYLEDSYAAIQRRRLIVQALERATHEGENVTIEDLTFHLIKVADQAHVFKRRTSKQTRSRIVGLWLMQELIALDDRQSLEGLGLLRVELDHEPSWQLPRALQSLGLSKDECWSLLTELLRTVRQQGVLTMPEGVDPRDEAFDPRRGPIYLREDGAEKTKKVLSWLPTRGVNRRLNYVRRVLDRIGSDADAREVLHGCWKFLVSLRDGWLASSSERGIGTVYQLDHAWLALSVPASDTPVFRCNSCRRISTVSIRGVCTTIGCAGELEETYPADDDDHYRRLYRQSKPVPLVAREHTAQWSSTKAAEIQQQFLRGEVNALSCSTTFELGVDVGELQSVVLRNMPPTTANYVQRAGRAGRRTDSAALVVSYAQRRSHDLSNYQNPTAMVSGEVRAPYVPLGNVRIDRRHAHSIALAAFFRYAKEKFGDTWSTAGEFFLGRDGETSAPSTRVAEYLTPVPDHVQRSLHRVLPTDVREEIGVDDGVAWVDHLAQLLEEVRLQLTQDVESFKVRRQDAFEQGKDDLVKRYGRTINTLERRPLLGFLASRNILPKYGFPVDTVELRTAYSDESVGADLELTRDLTSAIYEYAPGSEVVAGGLLWSSGGVYRLPDRELETRYYLICEHCQHYREGDQPLDHICPACSHPNNRPSKQYSIPEFGFVAARQTRRSSVPPKRSWNGATHVVATAAAPEHQDWATADGGLVSTEAGERGKLIAMSEGANGGGYLICDWCGWGKSIDGKRIKSHPHLLKNTDCGGPLQPRSLAHKYETDLVELTFDGTPRLRTLSRAQWLSGLFALLEGASAALEISRDDLNGTIHRRAGDQTTLVIFDTVPGGAGGAKRVASSLDTVVQEAWRRVSECDCGEETSCYGCLRNFRNQIFHEDLSRAAALDFLRPLAEGEGLTLRA